MGNKAWRFYPEKLLTEDGLPLWVAHSARNEIDVVCLQLRNLPDEVVLSPLDLKLADVDLSVYPGMPVSVIGHPLGLRPNVFLGIWKTGHIASDPEFPYRNRPAFLIDATTRDGMSGSPVVARAVGSHMTTKGLVITSGVVTRFLGIYASRIHDGAEIGCVWRPETIHQVIDKA